LYVMSTGVPIGTLCRLSVTVGVAIGGAAGSFAWHDEPITAASRTTKSVERFIGREC